ncbi:MAG TPA: hypothetical protein DD613_00060 [Firmicutes bacterium]|nr:hypothetical protein [Bacillota bacterium]
MDDLFTLNPKISSAICILIGYLLIDDLTANEQNVVGNWLMLISQILITNAAAQALIERRVHGPIMNTNSEEVKNSYDPIKYNIETLRNVLKEIYPDQMKNVFNNLKQGIGSMEDKYNNLHN